MKTPDLSPTEMKLDLKYVNRLLGMSFTAAEAKQLLERMRYGVVAVKGGKDLTVQVPAYRTDILHPMDLVEDIAIAYGYQNFEPEMPKIATVGKRDPLEKLCDTVREAMLGLGFQEVMTLIMSNKNTLFDRMMLPEEGVVEAEKPVSTEHSVCRTWLMPALVQILEKNRSREYPQNIFEIGDCVIAGGTQQKKLAGVIAHSRTNYSDTKAQVTGLLETLGLSCEMSPLSHPSFIEGRCAATDYGFFGELHPQVLENFGLETPVSGFEMNLNRVYNNLGV